MSDYEGDWEPVNPRPNVFTPPIPPDPLQNYVAPRSLKIRDAQTVQQQKPYRKRRQSSTSLPQGYRPTLQALFLPATGTGLGSLQNGHHIPAVPYENPRDRVLKLKGYQKFLSNQDNPSGSYQMMHSWKDFSRALPRQDTRSPLEVAKDSLADICVRTDAFIQVPQDDQHTFQIWGELEAVDTARRSLQAWEMSVKRPGLTPKHQGWVKQNAVDGREEHRLLRENLRRQEQETFQQFADGAMLHFEAYLLWPPGYDLENFIAEYDNGAINKLSHKFRCVINHEKEGNRYTRVAAEKSDATFQVYNRLLALQKEMVARKRRGLRATQCRLPSAAAYRDNVGLAKVQIIDHFTTHTYQRPILVGSHLPDGDKEIGHWNTLRDFVHRKYRIASKTALRSCIDSLHVSEKHIRMRVSFGDIVLDKYKRPSTNKDVYDINEFIEMVQDPGLEVVQRPLAIGPSFGFLDKLDSCEELQPDIGPNGSNISWAVHFDFAGGQGSTLRLEMEFQPNNNETSRSAVRWLNYPHNTTQDVVHLLQLYTLDFEKPGYQFHVGAVPLYKNSRTRKDLRAFEDEVKLKPSFNGLRFSPTKQSVYPHGNRDLASVEEITIAKYRFKDKDGTFELRRFDHFPQSPGEASALPSRIEWRAAYYYRGWDNLLSEFANIELGADVDWKRDISTFFPKSNDTINLPQGYKNFMKEVEEIQTLLAWALDENPAPATNGV
ncbi:hypothetical protein H2198_007297 [Neophaeococcomyces mojaviensis]|uniref:Uncharacterized protein n=1 Tax=Neophaeococcomyces mojaviensis TaxID=3383035 RepID=A0ACC3A0F4_9EURO|nr:hypothetical protein H2198_007297 [Knufia sp. JES_112]